MMGSIRIITGSMFSGKTTRLIQKYKQLVKQNMHVLVFNHSNDKRYNKYGSHISSHDNEHVCCTFINDLREILTHKEYSKCDFILIDEGQFFTDIKDTILHMVEKDAKHVVIGGLLTDSNRNKFGELLDIVPYADSIDFKYSKCCICDKNGLFSVKHTKSTNVVDIGTSDKYYPACRYHYLNKC
jgi:thymidine kinase